MIHYLLLILKIIGIILAILLGLLLLILALVLFVPIRYRGRVVRNPEQFYVRVKVSWLLSIVGIKVLYDEKKLTYRLCVFGIPLFRSDREEKPKREKKPKKSKRPKKSRKEKKNKKRSEEQETVFEEITPECAEDKETPEIPEISETLEKTEQAKQEGEPVISETSESESSQEQNKEEQSEGFFSKITNKIQKIRETIGRRIEKIKALLGKLTEIKTILTQPDSKKAIAFLFGKLKELIKHICPTKLKGSLIFGSGDPCSTGQILGIVSVLYARYGELISITPDFEEKRLECDLSFKGRIRVIKVLMIALKLLLHKELKQLIEEFKKIGN